MNIEDFEKMLPIVKHRLDDELEIHAEIQWRISERLTAANNRLETAKDDYDTTRADIAIAILKRQPDLTVAQKDAQLQISPDRLKAWDSFQAARKEAGRWHFMYESWRSRGFSLKSLCELHASDYFAPSSVTVDTKLNADSGRAALARNRQERTKERHSVAPGVRIRATLSP